MIKIFKQTNYTVSNVNYHLVFCPRYRRKIFLIDGLEARFKELVTQICEQNNCDVVALDCNIDYCHLVVNALPTISPHDVMKAVKAATSNTLINEFTKLGAMQSLWTRNYMATTDNISDEIIKEYVNSQKKRWDDQTESSHVCSECEHFLGMGDWSLCCDKKADLCYANTPACEIFSTKK